MYVQVVNNVKDHTSKIYLMEQQNEAYDKLKRHEKEYKESQKRLKEIQAGQLSDLESIINQRLTILNEDFPGGRMAPVIHFEDEEHYEFSTPKDDGTGTSWKGLIFFDLAILGLTVLPAIAHDSLMLKNIEAPSINLIIDLYRSFDKQIFIALDMIEIFSEEAQHTLHETRVLQLNGGGNELYGEQWSKK